MNSLVIVFICAILFFWAYRSYARKLEFLWQVDPKRSTPAFSKYDSIDYIPAKNWLVLFGHHFASIAGAFALHRQGDGRATVDSAIDIVGG